MVQIVDSGVFVTLERRRLPLDALAGIAPEEPMMLAAISASELLAGVHRADSPARRARRQTWVEQIPATFPVVPFDLQVARVHAQLWADLLSRGQWIGPHDLLIAATAVANHYAVLTDNVAHFARVPGLVVRQPTW